MVNPQNVFEDQFFSLEAVYSKSPRYKHHLLELEKQMDTLPYKDAGAYRKEYVDLIVRYGAATNQSYIFMRALARAEKNDKIQGTASRYYNSQLASLLYWHGAKDKMNLDNSIAEDTGAPKGGNTDMSLFRRRIRISQNDDGTPIYKQIQAHSEDEANNRVVQAYVESGRIWEFIKTDENQPKNKTETNFKTYTENWMNTYKKGKLKPRTWQTYNQYLIAQLFPAFGDMNIEDITDGDVQDYLNANKEQARKSLKNYWNLLKQILDSAVIDKIITENPAASLRVFNPSDKKTPRKALTVEQLREIVDALHKMENCEEKLLLAILIHTGARRGEVMGLRWEDIDFEKKVVHIRRNNTQITGKGAHIGTTKTTSGARDIPFGDHFKQLLQPFHATGYVFGGEEPFQQWDYDRVWRKLQKRVNLYGATAHPLRHTYLTMMAGEGVDLKTLQTIAGHSSFKTTMDIYVKPRVDKITAAGETMDTLLNGYAS